MTLWRRGPGDEGERKETNQIHLMVKEIADFTDSLCFPYVTYLCACRHPPNLLLSCPFVLQSHTIGPISLCPRLDFAQTPFSFCRVSPLCEYDRSPCSLSVFRRLMRDLVTSLHYLPVSFCPVPAVKYFPPLHWLTLLPFRFVLCPLLKSFTPHTPSLPPLILA